MEVDPPSAELPPPVSHLLAFSTLGASEKSEPVSNLPETLARPQKDLFSQDISVKMASELLFKLSGMLLQDVGQTLFSGQQLIHGTCTATHVHLCCRTVAQTFEFI